jgi:hypothetical protein
MSDEELRGLLKRSKPFLEVPLGVPKRLNPPVPLHHTGQHAHQWIKLDRRIEAPYERREINQTDAFAVIEAGATQFKGTTFARHTCMQNGSLAAQHSVFDVQELLNSIQGKHS